MVVGGCSGGRVPTGCRWLLGDSGGRFLLVVGGCLGTQLEEEDEC